MNRLRAFVSWSLMILCAGFLSSCMTGRTVVSPWLQGGERIGTLEVSPAPWGTETRYKDLFGRLVRIEKQNPEGRLLAGICVIQRSYDGNNLVMEQCLNSSGKLTSNEQGYAMRKWLYSVDSVGNRIEEECFFSENASPVLTRDGYAIIRYTRTANGQLQKVQFFNPARKPVPSVWLSVANVIEVQYSYLEGVTPVTCAVFLDATGKVITRKQLNGLTAGHWEQTTVVRSQPVYYVPPPSYHR